MAGKNHIRRFYKQFLYGINNRLKVRTVFNMFIEISRYQFCDDSLFIRDMINTTCDDEVIKRPSPMSPVVCIIMSTGIQVESFRLQDTIHDD